MKKLALFLFLLLYQTTSVVAAPLSHLWSKSFGDGYGEYINGIAVDPSGNVLVTGNFDSAIDLGGGPLVTSGDDGAFVAKFSPSGELIWGRGFHTSFLGFDAPVSDNIGNVIISVTCSPTLVQPQ